MILLDNICAGYSNRPILKDINLQINSGEFVHILGGNGAGKSTLFNVILGKVLPNKGTLLLDGTSGLNLKQLASKIAYVSQNTHQGTVPEFTIQENMELAFLRGQHAGLRFRSPNANTIKDQLALCELGLEDRIFTKAANLSGGQRQALSIIMALQRTPKILLLDEHTSALDPNTAKRIMELTNKVIRQHHITCLIITHNLHDVVKYGDRIIILKSGAVAQQLNSVEKSTLDHHHLIDLMLKVESSLC